MDPQLGRFITADPTVQRAFDPQDLNRYAYARNNPIRFTDPTGLGWLSKLFAVIGALIATALLPATAPMWAFVLVGAIGGAIGGLAGAAIEKSSLASGAIGGAAIGAAVGAGVGAAQGAGGVGGAGGSGSGDLGGMSAAFRPEQAQGYVYINGAAVKEGAWQGLKTAVGKGFGLAGGALKAVGSQLMPAAYASVTIGVTTLTPGSGGLNSNQQLSRFKEDSKSQDEPGGQWFRHYTSFSRLREIQASGFIRATLDPARAKFGPGVYLTEPGLIDPQIVDPASYQTYIDVFLVNEEIETSITAIQGTAEYLYHDKATSTPKNLDIRGRPVRSGPDK